MMIQRNYLEKNLILKVFKTSNILLIIALCILLAGCSKGTTADLNSDKSISLIEKFENTVDLSNSVSTSKNDSVLSENLSAKEYSLPTPKGGEIGDQTVYGDKIFYVVLYIKEMSNYSKKAEIYSYDINDGSVNLIYEYEDPSHDVHLNELRGNDQYLFWTTLLPDNSWQLNKLDLENKKVETIRTSKDTQSQIPPVIIVTDQYLSWYETTNIDKQVQFVLNIYSIEENEIETINDNVYLPYPYTRAYINGDIVTYLTSDENNIKMNIYNIKSGISKVLVVPGNKKIFNAASNQSYTVWHDEYMKANVFIYKHNTDELLQLNFKEMPHKIFAIDLLDNYLFINDRESNNIIAFDIENKTKKNITSSLNNKNMYVLTRATADHKYIAQNTVSKDKKCLIVNIQNLN